MCFSYLTDHYTSCPKTTVSAFVMMYFHYLSSFMRVLFTNWFCFSNYVHIFINLYRMIRLTEYVKGKVWSIISNKWESEQNPVGYKDYAEKKMLFGRTYEADIVNHYNPGLNPMSLSKGLLIKRSIISIKLNYPPREGNFWLLVF